YEGKIGSVDSKPGQRITSPMVPIITVIEPCGHDIQYNGLCTLCGKDLTISDYYEDVTKRATINMSHDATGIRVSVDEAQKMEKKNAQRLRKLKKLSLIIDLDQTIVHAYASQDPKFEDWLIDNYTGPDADTPREKRQLPSDIGAFFLPDSPHKYFIKLRPGLREFLDRVSALYELHIYTMGTRHYAEAVARVIDPDGRFFRERILSRDESGSLTQKSIRRLFPCDQSMVVMLDDRADVWQWSPNLIKILPYAFFTGVGDINSGHLPANSTAVHKAMQEKKDEQAAEQGGDRGSKLVDNDCELKVVGGVLESIHETYYEEYESRKMFDEFKSG
ncbi:CTD phosphatase Fcp1, partial [Spiromyces aspiralis]